MMLTSGPAIIANGVQVSLDHTFLGKSLTPVYSISPDTTDDINTTTGYGPAEDSADDINIGSSYNKKTNSIGRREGQ